MFPVFAGSHAFCFLWYSSIVKPIDVILCDFLEFSNIFTLWKSIKTFCFKKMKEAFNWRIIKTVSLTRHALYKFFSESLYCNWSTWYSKSLTIAIGKASFSSIVILRNYQLNFWRTSSNKSGGNCSIYSHFLLLKSKDFSCSTYIVPSLFVRESKWTWSG